MLKTRKFWIAMGALFLLLVLTLKIIAVLDKKSHKPLPAEAPFAVEVCAVAPALYEAKLKFPAITEADKDVRLEAEVESLVLYVNKEKGRVYPQGTVIVALDTKALPLKKKELEERVAYLKQAKDTETRLNEKSLSSVHRALKSSADLAAAQADLKAVDVELEKSVLKMPFHGVLEDTFVDAGTVAKVGTELAHVADLSTLVVKFKIPERLWQRFQKSTKAEVIFLDGHREPAVITFKSRSADAKTHAFAAQAKMENSQGAHPQGESVDVQVLFEPQQAFSLPQQALTLNDAGVMGVKVVDEEQKVRFYPIEVINEGTEGVLVQGLPMEPLKIIQNGQEYVREGQVVKPIQSMAPTS